MKKFTDKINESNSTNPTPSAEDFIQEYLDVDNDFVESMKEQMSRLRGFDFYNIPDLMIQFAKFHVKAAVKEQIRVENDRIESESELDRLTEEALNNLYPLANIK